MKKRFFLFFFVAILSITTLCSFTVPLEANVNDEEKTEEIVYESRVVILESKNGLITTDVLEGHVGDLVTINVEPDILYVLQTLKVNGAILEPLEDGETYQFALIEGDNIIEATFVISDEKLQELADLLESVKEGNWKDIFTFENVFVFINWFITAFCTIGFFKTLIKTKKFKTLTMQEILNSVDETINKKVAEGVTNILKDFFGPLFDSFTQKIDNVSTSSKVLTKCFILMQEGTPESRIAILNELDKIKEDEDGLTLKIKNLISDEITKNEQKATQTKEAIENLKKVNEEDEVKETKVEEPKEDVFHL